MQSMQHLKEHFDEVEHSLQGSGLGQDRHVQSFAATLLHAIYSATPEPLPFDGFADSVWPMYCKVLESQSEYYYLLTNFFAFASVLMSMLSLAKIEMVHITHWQPTYPFQTRE